ncbi:type-F conjugative transfer system pilin assembly thiol-disulfide isomerase TrbB [Moritella viscosa]|uniref:type-F conjugative transfer system pilin assembly thiol-disulfide isomerase TrbB n=1 Tax=Moritella viscosa TaxID=80854 RepID=UPI00091FB43D|nr:type-F conjugative transfer system pilin assembly thiol-disulfide isomerase TrbB [Moritella viscosa]SGZ09496.1 Type-F conjugative transfer system pilin assembly thiol-disulfide isomerase TrbB [Moritella viscosa]
MKTKMKHATRSLFFTLIVLCLGGLQGANASERPTAMNGQYAMVYFFRSDCSYCRQFAPKLKAFAKQNNLFTYDFTLDGKGTQDYPSPIASTPDIAQQFFTNPSNITVPATFLVNVNTRKYAKVSIGDVSSYQLQETFTNIMNDHKLLEAME